ncbi:RHS repeat-associated core domain-containing protein [Pseudomonas sp. LSJ-87]|uniref:RHS repeat-associated core domain-containing protein n=1 Tax=Pseudomonas sp. LSJ-87 TaxID=3079932 RepID=UPI002940CB4D|nr:RHS repeat-associated core domain-containing protein [Pseudomonas sp. LSJ-87]MDV5097111.1 RHS repeat-associated core domain-containing protein [Pseudomonas sp. LSJ-87]
MDKCSGVVAPTETFDQDDVGASTELLAQWLTDLTGHLVNWRTVITVAEVLPVAGSVFAATDAIGDIISLVQGTPEYRADLFNWVGLGINLFAIAPIPGMSPARKVMRPVLKSARASSKDGMAQALLIAMENALADVCRGDLENFVKEIDRQLQTILASFAQKVVDICQFLADLIRSAADGTVKSTALTVIFPGLRLVAEASDYAKRKTGYGLSRDQLGLGPDPKLLALLEPIALSLESLGRMAGNKIAQIGSKATPGSLAAILDALKLALSKRKPVVMRANVNADGRVTQVRRVHPQNGTEAAPRQRPARADPNCRKAGVAGGTGCSISFALGSETISHTDFALPGAFPINWNRTYRSTLGAYDHSPFGARWITPFSSRFDLAGDTLVYHGIDGRSQHYPLPDVSKHHHDPIENLWVGRPEADKLVLARGHVMHEVYVRDGDQFRLELISQQGGARIALFYEHRHADRSVLSDLVTYQYETAHQHIHTQLDDHGRIVALWLMRDGQPERQVAGYEFDAQGDLCSARDETGAQWTYQYAHHLITRYTDRTGRGMNLEWVGEGSDAKAIREWADDGSLDTRLNWDPDIRLTCVTDANGNQTRHFYDSLGYTYRIIHPNGDEEWLYRDRDKNVTQHVHPDGTADHYVYDNRGNLLQHTRPDYTTVHHAYDDLDQRFKTRDAEGGLWKYDYDQRGNIIETQDPLENKTLYTYNSDNLPIAITDANGGEKKLAYNPDGQLTSYTDCSGKTTQWKYNALGQLAKLINAAGEVTEYQYEAGQLVLLIHPDKTTERFERDAEGRLLSHTDALYRRTAWTYNEAGLIHQRHNANDTTLTYHWDKLGQLVRLRNENNSEASFKYDPVGRLLKETGFDKETTHYLYDNGSNLPTRRVDGDRTMHFEYDPMGRLIQRKAARRGGDKWEVETFAYDGNGNLLAANNEACRLQWFYDAAGNNTREHQWLDYLVKPQVAVFRHEYDTLNQRIATTRPDGHRVSWLTYGSGHLLALKLDDQELISYERDDLHREIGRVQGNGLVQRQTWSPNGQLLEQTLARQGESRRIAARSYRYDEAGQLCHIDDLNRGDLHYRYDPVGRLLEASRNYEKETFAFDPASNLLDPEAPPNPNPHSPHKLMDNVLRSYCGTQYRYDERGNLQERIENGKTGKFTWDLYDRLRRYEDERLVVEFGYDALGRRVYKDSRSKYRKRIQAGPVWNENARRALDEKLGCDLTLFIWDGDTLAFEQRGRDGKGRTTHYVFEPGTFVPVAQGVMNHIEEMLHQPAYSFPYDIDRDPVWQRKPMPKPFDALSWYQCDHLGTAMELTSNDGNVQWHGAYKAWGHTSQKQPDAELLQNCNSLHFQGQYFDSETGLHYNRHRYYDSRLGRFIGKDPIGFLGGINIYMYAPNPTEWADPLGLARKCQLGTYESLTNLDANRGDQLDAHEFIRHEALEQIGMTPEGKRSRNNPSIAIPRPMHIDAHRAESRLASFHLGLGRDEFQIGSNGKPSKRQMDIWQGALRASGVPASRVRVLRNNAQQFLDCNCFCP